MVGPGLAGKTTSVAHLLMLLMLLMFTVTNAAQLVVGPGLAGKTCIKGLE